jgi:hypothetical protein
MTTGKAISKTSVIVLPRIEQREVLTPEQLNSVREGGHIRRRGNLLRPVSNVFALNFTRYLTRPTR